MMSFWTRTVSYTHLDVYKRQPGLFEPAEGCYYSIGIHPWKVLETEPEDWKRLEDAAGHPSVLAIGAVSYTHLCMLVYVRKYLKILLQVFYECGFVFGIQVAGQEKRFFMSGGKVFYKLQ